MGFYFLNRWSSWLLSIRLFCLSIPFMGFYFLNLFHRIENKYDGRTLSIPFMGFYFLNQYGFWWRRSSWYSYLSIPFMGFYFLNLDSWRLVKLLRLSTFNSLYGILFLESRTLSQSLVRSHRSFQFPLWDSISWIISVYLAIFFLLGLFQFPLWDSISWIWVERG